MPPITAPLSTLARTAPRLRATEWTKSAGVNQRADPLVAHRFERQAGDGELPRRVDEFEQAGSQGPAADSRHRSAVCCQLRRDDKVPSQFTHERENDQRRARNLGAKESKRIPSSEVIRFVR